MGARLQVANALGQAMTSNSARQSTARSGITAVLVVCCAFSSRWLRKLVELFNLFAFTHVAIYGLSFVEASRSTWLMLQTAGQRAIHF